ncbi:unnamed protein product [Camellia sinensis]
MQVRKFGVIPATAIMEKTCFPCLTALFFAQYSFLACFTMNVSSFTTDEYALLAFKAHITFDNPHHILANNWSADTSVCDWIGVSCGKRHHRVTALNLPDMGIGGTIPPHIGNLSFLSYFNITNNTFQGHLPVELARLHLLNVVDFNFNNFSGGVPTWFGNLPKLQYLCLASNSFTGLVPPSIGNISTLESLDLRDNFLEGGVPKEIGHLTKLKWLQMEFNNLSGSIPPTIFNISSLQWIEFRHNMLSGSLPEDLCVFLPKLEFLRLSLNEFDGQIPTTLGECRELQFLSLSANKFSDFIPKGIGNLTMLQFLYLGVNNFRESSSCGCGSSDYGGGSDSSNNDDNSGCSWGGSDGGCDGGSSCGCNYGSESDNGSDGGDMVVVVVVLATLMVVVIVAAVVMVLFVVAVVVGEIPHELGSLRSLKLLALFLNKLTGNIPKEIGNCTLLSEVYLDFNNLTGSIPEEFGKLPKMEILYLQNNNLMGSIPATIFNISTLQEVAFLQNQLSGKLPSSTGVSLPNLKKLFLGENELSGIVPDSISNASKLVKLGLSDNKFNGSIPSLLGNLRLLEYLDLQGNNFTCESSSSELSFLNSLTSIRRLRKLWISFNPLNGILPTSIGNLSNSLEIIDASYCEIRGSIPSEIANLSNLISLVMDGNELTGLIPTTIKSLKKLQVLNLYDNRIQGFIPVNLCYLKNLGDLQLGKNNLSGLIPACLGNITSLRYLDLDSNKLISSIPTSLWSLKDLLKLNLSSNYLSGYLPLELGNLKVAIRIDLSMNQFSGQIPNTIGGLQGVMNLSLAHNRLQGPIPQSIGSLVDLEFCDLSVEDRGLRGEIPSRGSFANFTYQSFMSNEALCGAPRLQVPPCHADSHRQSRIKQMLLIVYFLLPIASVLLAITFVFAFIRCRQRRNQNPIQTDLLPARIRHGRITYHELSRATDMFSESNLLGVGSFSSVYKGMFPGKMIFAIKVFKLELDGAFKSFETECEILRNIRHRNLTKVISSCSTLDFKALVLEYMPNGTLEKWLYSHNYFLDMLQRMDIMIDVACAFEYLHHGYSVPVAHCDLKPSDVLLDDDMVAHVSDFGIAKLLGVGESIAQTRTIATFGYIAPEYGLEGLVSTKCDVYSYGIMLMETFTRTKPTDARFDGGLSLKCWVVDALPNAIVQVLDANLLRQDIEHNNAKVQCVSSLMQLALNCSEDSPEERMIMKDVLVSIKKIRLRL